MDRKILKENAKKVFYKKYWYCVAVAFLMMLGVSGSSFSFSFNVDLDKSFNEGFNAGFNAGFNNFPNTFESAFEWLTEDPMLFTFIAFILIMLIVFAVLSILVFSSFKSGGIRFFMKLRKNQPTEINEVFENFRDKTFLNIAKTTFFKVLSVLLWSLLFYIPGIIKHYEYWAVDYILAVRPDIDRKEAFRLSKVIMDGNKWELWVLELSFIGWNILASFSMGLAGILFVNPYMQATYVEFFAEIKDNAIAQGKITPFDIPDYQMLQQLSPVMPIYNEHQPPNFQSRDFEITPQPIQNKLDINFSNNKNMPQETNNPTDI